jgi:purine-binding chemotaxis protein CheW
MSEAAMTVESSTMNLACFEIKGQPYAIDISYVLEIVRTMQISPLPNAPSLIEGVIDLRGSVIPVVDLVRVLSRGKADTGLNSRIIVLEVEGLVLGIQVDAATDVLSFDTQHMEDVPDLATHAGYDAVRHVVRRPNETPIMVLSVEALIENIYRSALPASATRSELG